MKFKQPFPHTVFDDFIPLDTVRQINAEWPDMETESGKFTLKRSSPILRECAARLFSELGTKSAAEETGIAGLFADPELFGGGYHAVPVGGFLKMHVDFNSHPKGWHRRVNALIYLNEEWREEWGGHLQLGLDPAKAKRIEPIAGRCVIFETTETSWHGHPHPLRCPPDRERRSLAFYYYTEAQPQGVAHTTIYKKAG